MAHDKLLAEWFWTDRWMGSSAFLLPMEARGLYREMLTQAWRRGARLPNNHEAIRRATGCTDAEWSRNWPQIEHYWRIGEGNTLVNDTQLKVYTDATAMSGFARDRARKAANTRWGHDTGNAQASSRAMLDECTPSLSLSLSPDPSQTPILELKNKLVRNGVAAAKNGANGNGNGRSKHPVFAGERFVVFDWMLEDMMRTLGPHTDNFDLHEWFFTLDATARTSELVIAKSEQWPWLQAALMDEARRRGLPIATVTPASKNPLEDQLRAVRARKART